MTRTSHSFVRMGTRGNVFTYPAKYRSSGVMTFLVDRHGEVLQKDQGRKAVVLAKATKSFEPSSSWQNAEDLQEETASGKIAP